MRGVLLPSIASLAFFVLAPGTVAGLVPWKLSGWRLGEPLLGWSGGRVFGGLLVAAGLVVLVDCFVRFAIVGRGTPAPPLPTERLVVSGLYRHVRNPMYLAVVSVILGQAALLGSRPVAWYGALVWCGFHAFVAAHEEPTLRARYGSEYDGYCGAVRRWLPRARPWRGAQSPPASQPRRA
jgi:protein-S-isoprenylcysteine O-methyltransferase Ste14